MKKIIVLFIFICISQTGYSMIQSNGSIMNIYLDMTSQDFISMCNRDKLELEQVSDFFIKDVTRYLIEDIQVSGEAFYILVDIYQGKVKKIWATHQDNNEGLTGSSIVASLFNSAYTVLVQRHGDQFKKAFFVTPQYREEDFFKAFTYRQAHGSIVWKTGTFYCALSILHKNNFPTIEIEYIDILFYKYAMDYVNAQRSTL